MSAVMRLWFLALLMLVRHATSAPSLLGCIKGAFCAKPLPTYRLPRSIEGKELIGFVPHQIQFSYMDAWSRRINFKAPALGPGAYLIDNLHTALKLSWELYGVTPRVCAIYAPKEFHQDWSKIYVPKLTMIRKKNYKVRYEGYQLLESKQKLETYLALLGKSNRGHDSILVTDWQYDDVAKGEGFIMKLPQSKYEHCLSRCYSLYESNTEQIQLQWSEKFKSDWKLENDAEPLYFLTEVRENGKLFVSSERSSLGHDSAGSRSNRK